VGPSRFNPTNPRDADHGDAHGGFGGTSLAFTLGTALVLPHPSLVFWLEDVGSGRESDSHSPPKKIKMCLKKKDHFFFKGRL